MFLSKNVMTEAEYKQLVAQLQEIFERAINANNRRSFFVALSEYLDLFDNEIELKGVIDRIIETKRQNVENVEKLGNQVIEECREASKKIVDYVEKNKIENLGVRKELEDFKSAESGNLRHSSGPVKGRHSIVTFALMELANDPEGKHQSFINKFGDVNERNQVETWTFAPTLGLWRDEEDRLERMKLTKLWYSWDQLVLFYQIYARYENIAQDKFEKRHLMDMYSLHKIFEELKAILEGKSEEETKPWTFRWEDYKTHLQRLNSFVKRYQPPIFVASPEDILLLGSPWTYEEGVFTINGLTARFEKNEFRARMLELLTRNDEARKKDWSWDEVYEEIEQHESRDLKKDRQKIYDAAQRITERIAAKTGTTEFLSYTINTVRINPKYAR